MKKIEIAVIIAILFIVIQIVPDLGTTQPGYTVGIGDLFAGVVFIILPLIIGYIIGIKEGDNNE